MNLNLKLFQGHFAIAQLPPDSKIPDWAQGNEFLAFVRTSDEFSVVCDEKLVPKEVRSERGWRALQVTGILDFSLVGILANLAESLARVGVSIFVISTFNTDTILIKKHQLEDAFNALHQAGHSVEKS